LKLNKKYNSIRRIRIISFLIKGRTNNKKRSISSHRTNKRPLNPSIFKNLKINNAAEIFILSSYKYPEENEMEEFEENYDENYEEKEEDDNHNIIEEKNDKNDINNNINEMNEDNEENFDHEIMKELEENIIINEQNNKNINLNQIKIDFNKEN
jgi:hypothetical protein